MLLHAFTGRQAARDSDASGCRPQQSRLELSTGRKRWARPDPNPIFQAWTQILIYQPVWARFKPEIKNITLNFAENLIKKKFYPSTFALVTNSSCYLYICNCVWHHNKLLWFVWNKINPRFWRLMNATRCSLCFILSIAKTLSFTENLDFAPASGAIEARQFFKNQARTRPEKPEPERQLRL